MATSSLPASGGPSNLPIPAVLTLTNNGPTLNIELLPRAEQTVVAIDVMLPGGAPFATLLLPLDPALDLNLRVIGIVAGIRRFGP